MGPEMLQKAFLQQLESYFGGKVKTELRQFLMKNWTYEVHLRGGPVIIHLLVKCITFT